MMTEFNPINDPPVVLGRIHQCVCGARLMTMNGDLPRCNFCRIQEATGNIIAYLSVELEKAKELGPVDGRALLIQTLDVVHDNIDGELEYHEDQDEPKEPA